MWKHFSACVQDLYFYLTQKTHKWNYLFTASQSVASTGHVDRDWSLEEMSEPQNI